MYEREWLCEIYFGDKDYSWSFSSWEKTAPMVICLAAKKAVEGEN